MLSPAPNYFPLYNGYLFPLAGSRSCATRCAGVGIRPSEGALTRSHAGLHQGRSPPHKGAFYRRVKLRAPEKLHILIRTPGRCRRRAGACCWLALPPAPEVATNPAVHQALPAGSSAGSVCSCTHANTRRALRRFCCIQTST